MECATTPVNLTAIASCEVSIMTTVTIREQLHKQIDNLPDDAVERIADFTLFVTARRKKLQVM